MQKSYYWLWFQIVLGFILLVGALPCVFVKGLQKKHNHILRVGVSLWPVHQMLYLAKENQCFLDDKVELVTYGSFGDVLRAFEWGQIDAMAVSLNEVVMAHKMTNKHPKIILVTDYGSHPLMQVSSKKTFLDNESQKKIMMGVEPGSVASTYIHHWIVSNKNDCLWDVCGANPLDMSSLLKEEIMDSVVCGPPFCYFFENDEDYGVRLMDTVQSIQVIAVSKECLDKKSLAINHFIKGWEQMMRYFGLNTMEWIQIMAHREHIKADNMRLFFSSTTMPSIQEQLSILQERSGMLSTQIELLVETLGLGESIEKYTWISKAFVQRMCMNTEQLVVP